MVKKISGYILIGIGLLGSWYFTNYAGNSIPFPTVWFITGLAVAGAGAYFVASARMKKQTLKDNEIKAKLYKIKETGERILINFENCEFKTGTIDRSDQQIFSSIQMIDALYDPNRNHIKNNSAVTYLIYKHKNGNAVEKFVSQAFSIDEIMLKYYVSKNNIILYVDRFNRNRYFFNVE